jgi:predicted cation transporter
MTFLMITQTAPEPTIGAIIGLILVALGVLILPFVFKVIEHNLELFFLIMGILSVTIASLWSGQLVLDALKAPVMIGSLPIGIFQVVLIFGIIILFFHRQFTGAITTLANKISIRPFTFALVLVLGLLSSIISVILTSVLLAEIAACLPLDKKERVKLVVIACFAIGLGAVLTPLGEPLSTILVQKLAGAPYFAGFTFPFTHFALYVIPGVIAIALFGAFWISKKTNECVITSEYSETLRNVVVRAAKVYAFVAALVLFGEGLKPVVEIFITKVPAAALYWINMVSAILDNATLTAIEITPNLTLSQIISIIVSLLVAGGMLIPGNIPNIVAAGKLKISMKEWAVIGVPVGLVLLAIYFIVLIPLIF